MRSRTSLLAIALLLMVACGGPPGSTGAPIGTVGPLVTATPPPATTAPATSPAETPAPSPTLPAIGIIGVECLAGQTVRLHVWINDERGIVWYRLWSTWGGGGETTRSFPTPYRTSVDEYIEFTHAIVDPEPRIHQFGLEVTLAGVAEPILTYAVEPGDRCPGH